MSAKIAVVIPSYRVRDQIEGLLRSFGGEVSKIYIVDDACPQETGKWVKANVEDSRVEVLFHEKNQGVGGATLTGFQKAAEDGADVIVKCDGDGQMDPKKIPSLVQPILDGRADYAKGNRFFDLSSLKGMPLIRIFGNSILSFMSKFSSGYWNIMDPTNGFLAIRAKTLALLPIEKINRRFFFESDLLFRLYLARAVVVDVPISAIYGDEISNLKIHRIVFDFSFRHLVCFIKRIFYCYFLRDFSLASVELVFGSGLLCFGAVYGGYFWKYYSELGVGAPVGTVMIACLTILMGFQLLLSALNFDVQNVPRR